jgi:hypothetical protein
MVFEISLRFIYIRENPLPGLNALLLADSIDIVEKISFCFFIFTVPKKLVTSSKPADA